MRQRHAQVKRVRRREAHRDLVFRVLEDGHDDRDAGPVQLHVAGVVHRGCVERRALVEMRFGERDHVRRAARSLRTTSPAIRFQLDRRREPARSKNQEV